MDHARNHLDELIAQYINTHKLLTYMESEGRAKIKNKTRGTDTETCDMLKLAAKCVLEHRKNLEHVRATYDAKFNDSMPSDDYPISKGKK